MYPKRFRLKWSFVKSIPGKFVQQVVDCHVGGGAAEDPVALSNFLQ
jgi:hypothetical protein